MKLDNRPRKLLVKGVPEESVEVARNWYGVRIFSLPLHQDLALKRRVCRQRTVSRVLSDWGTATSLFLSKQEVPRNRCAESRLTIHPQRDFYRRRGVETGVRQRHESANRGTNRCLVACSWVGTTKASSLGTASGGRSRRWDNERRKRAGRERSAGRGGRGERLG